jgi:hypothetical protein
MKKIIFLILFTLPLYAQEFQLNDPYTGANLSNEVNFQVDRYYPIFGLSEKPFSNEKIIRLSDRDKVYTAYIYFKDQYTPPKYDKRSKTLRLYFPNAYYDYILTRLEKDDAYIVYREYKDGHNWGEIYFDKYP